MTAYNLWLGTSQNVVDIAVESLNWDEETQGEYTGPLRNRSRMLFELMQDARNREAQFAKPVFGGTTFRMWSLDFEETVERMLLVEAEIIHLEGEYPGELDIVGAWKWNGNQVGGNNTPRHSIHNQAWQFMPAWVGATSNADLQDINLLLGQAPRNFD